MSKRIVFMGAGAVGGYVGGHSVERGEIEAHPRNVEKL